ncbi:MAG: STAS domain-containing protein [Bacteroidota bacterium]
MRFEKSVEERYTLIKLLEEKLDTLISPSLKSEFIMLNTNGVRNILLNMEQVKYSDSSGLSSILIANRLCRNAGGLLVLTNLQEHVQKLVKISQLESILYVVPTEEEGREAIFMAEIEREITSKGDDQPEATAH